MNYQEAIEYIHSIYKFGSKLGLENINYLLNLMDNPHKDLKVIHVAGTNGKGSTASYIHSVLVEAGYKVGLYTSPYLEEFTERMRVNRENIPKEELSEITAFVKDKAEKMIMDGMNHPTEFEVVTAIGFEYFKRQEVDFLVLEVGLGGRGDSTNVINNPLVSVITPIAFDHMDYLGDTLEKIAYEKAGIIKKDSYVVSYPQEEEAMKAIEDVCRKQNAKLIKAPIDTVKICDYSHEGQLFHVNYGEEYLENISISMLGEHQVQNATMALTVLNVLEKEYHIKISREALYEGFKKALWPGRLEVIRKNPTVLIDGAHNLHGMKALSKTIKGLFSDKNIILVIGILGDKEVGPMVDEIVPMAQKVILTKPNNPRAMSLEELETIVEKHNKLIIKEEEIKEGVKAALSLASHDDLIVFCGSLYMIGEVRSLCKE